MLFVPMLFHQSGLSQLAQLIKLPINRGDLVGEMMRARNVGVRVDVTERRGQYLCFVNYDPF
ncbi:hypothetical protein HanIR_Chr03g0132231 [Helianthus annuus]|nr:hypothetical protein HanIR_Chr03g0132231 [Helianthus annuus]